MKSEKMRTAFLTTLVALVLLAGGLLLWLREKNGLRSNVLGGVGRVKADMRSLSIAVEAYYVENNSYPAWSVGLSKNAFQEANFPDRNLAEKLPTFAVAPLGTHMHTLTTPIPYISGFPRDRFVRGCSQPFCYWRDEYSLQFLLWSPGPDMDYDLTVDNIADAFDDPTFYKSQPSPSLLMYSFDPTNGVLSSGDVFRVKQ